MKIFRIATLTTIIAGIAWAAAHDVPYPEGYRDWHHVKSMLIEEGHPLFDSFGGIHHLYANPKALEGYRSGRFPDGAVIVFDLLEAERSDGAVVEGPRKVLGVMHRDQRRYETTGGWGFEGFARGEPTTRVVGENASEACYACHTSQKDRDFVFSRLRD